MEEAELGTRLALRSDTVRKSNGSRKLGCFRRGSSMRSWLSELQWPGLCTRSETRHGPKQNYLFTGCT